MQFNRVFCKPLKWNVALVVLLGLFGCGQGQSQSRPHRMPEVSIITVRPQRVVLTTELPGRTAPFRIAEIRPQVSGLILKRLFKEGSNVKAGQILYQIDPASFRAALENAKANLAVARKNADRARAALTASLANVARQRATLALARQNRKRFEEAFESRSVSASQRDHAVTEAKVAEATLHVYESKVESDRTAIAAAEASIKQAEAAVKTASINLGYTRITAPISGRIGRSHVTEGAIVTAYQPVALASIQQLDPMYVDVPQSTADLLHLKRRMRNGHLNRDGAIQNKVRLFLEDGSAYPLEGTLKFRDVTVDPTTGSVILRMVFPNTERILLPEMFVRAVITEGINEHAFLVPQQSVTRDRKGNPYALIVSPEGKVVMRMLTIERAIGNKWLVTSGLVAGDRVIIEGLQYVRPGMHVKVVPIGRSRGHGSGPGTKGKPALKKRPGGGT